MRLPQFALHQPRELDEALDLLQALGGDGRVLAGGTDLLVRMKQRLLLPGHLVSLTRLRALAYVRREAEAVCIGAGTTLHALSAAAAVREALPALAEALAAVGAVGIQHHRGTLGGNLCQENRCLFYNQSEFLRGARPPCHKAGGKTCYALEGSDRCRSALASDIAPALIALGATATAASKSGVRTFALVDLYTAKGEAPLALAPGELLTEIRVPLPPAGAGAAYRRLAYRSAVDYPLVCAGVGLETAAGRIARARIVVGAVSSAPLLLAQASGLLAGKAVDDRAAVAHAAARAMDHAAAFVVNNTIAPVAYRQQMIAVLVRRAIEAALARAVGTQAESLPCHESPST